MKTNVLTIFFLLFFVTIKAQTPISSNETISVTTGYTDNLSMAWNVNSTDPTKPLIVKYTIGTEYLYDFVKIYSIENINGNETAILLVSLSGIQSGSISSVIPSGKVRITFTSDGSYSYNNNPSFCSGIQISFSTDTSYPSSSFANSYISGNSITNGNVGIGVLNPSYKLEVNGTAKFFEGIQCARTISFADNAIFNVTKAIIPDLRSSSFLMPQYGVAAPGAGGSCDFWISGNNNIRMFTAGNPTPKFNILNNGNVGIGTTTPTAKLDVVGDVQIDGNKRLGCYLADLFTYDNKNIGHYSLGWFNDSWNPGANSLWMSSFGGIKFFAGGQPRLSINSNGYVGIGLTNPDKMLTVNGAIHAKEIIVDVKSPLADYVFHPDYQLMPLHKVEQFVKTNRHLPEIPSAAEVKENGLNMGEMQNKLLQKIEELTLYMIDLQKVIDLQSARIQILESKVKQ